MKPTLKIKDTKGRVYGVYVVTDDVIRIRCVFDEKNLEEEERSYILKSDTDSRIVSTRRDSEYEYIETKTITLRYKINEPIFAFEMLNKGGDVVYADVPGRSYVTDHMKCRLHYSKHFPGAKYLGCGECTGPLLKNGLRIRCDPKDAIGYDAKAGGPLYKHIPMHIRAVPLSNRTHHAVGVWYHTTRPLVMDMAREVSGYWPRYTYTKIEGGDDLDVFLINGPKIRDVTSRFLKVLTGLPVKLPRHALGYLGSTMYFAELEKDCDKAHTDFVDKCRARRIPIDGFQLSSGYTAQPAADSSKNDLKRCTMTWNLKRFPEPEKFMKIDMLKKRHVIVSPNTKPAMLLKDHPYYDRFAKIGGFFASGKDETKPYVGTWWGGPGSFIDFTNPKARELFKTCLKENFITTSNSVWCDNNEFELELDENPPTAYWDGAKTRRSAAVAKTLQANLMAKCAYEACSSNSLCSEEPYIISRSGATGIWRYAQVWSGDNRTSWSALRNGVSMLLGGGLCGLVNYGHDCEGFAGGRPSRELFVRWIQHGCFQARFSIHSCNDDNSVTLPWMYDTPEESSTGIVQDVNCGPSKTKEVITPSAAIAAAIRLRYELMPFWYSLHVEASIYGTPILRPYCFCFQDIDHSERMWNESETYMLGSSLLVANVLKPNSETRGIRSVYLPRSSSQEHENGWYDFWTGQCYRGGQNLNFKLENVSHIPLFLRGSAIVPLMMDPSPLSIRSTRDRARALRFLVTTLQSCERFTLYKEKDRAIDFSTSLSSSRDCVDFVARKVRANDYEEYVFEFFVESVPSSSDSEHHVDQASGKGAKSVFLSLGDDSEKMIKLPMFLDRSQLSSSEIGGWYFDTSGARTIVRIPSSSLKLKNCDKKDCTFLVRVSYSKFDLIGM
jgi:alpha-glucosidase